jgi:hypothetical protein
VSLAANPASPCIFDAIGGGGAVRGALGLIIALVKSGYRNRGWLVTRV